jgi:hypothetical protein
MTLVASGRRTEAEALQLELVDRAEQAYMSGAILAIFPLACGRINEAFEFFEKAYEERDGLLPLLTCWPAFDPARDDPRFDILLKRIGLGRDS